MGMGWNHKDTRRCSFWFVFLLQERKEERSTCNSFEQRCNRNKTLSVAKNRLYSNFTPHTFNTVLPCYSVWSISNACKVHGATVPKGEIHLSISYATTISMTNICKLRHRGNRVSLQLSSTFMPGWKRFQGVGAGRWMNEWKSHTSAAEFNLPLDSAPGLLICKVGTSAQVMLIWLQASAGIIRFSSLKKKCLGDEGWIGSVESLLQRQPSTGQNKEGWMIGCICLSVSGHKRPALRESSSYSVGGFSAFFLLSV